ncbi:uncharacterized protein LOC128879975 [Hylaeus volcanicus]|uniref:uncharacterized protein LOC128879975 n=1 Tax=Hylaeus volcanicus TaxID=313075 RepID=UPI0023B79FE3|nr:uncharacterized protein LOC128879975 [Hylaeus volcanicus]XP_053985537.1 uncharacterized protein LOC128879975 [Hylaeus volcanicus]XP_053985538.1 uncharacterized protein LOC128879975 [Hylaeus volcanicus]
MTPSIEPLPVLNLDSVLAQSLGRDVQIKNLEWRPLTAPGDNFGSIMLAVDVTVTRANETETLNLVAKLPPTSTYLLQLFNSPVTFKKELLFYSVMAKEFEELQLECGLKEESLSIIAPKYFGGRLGLRNPDQFDDQALIVLENLKYSGYTTEDRLMGLDKKHIEFALTELAKLHALTIALKTKKPSLFEKLEAGVLEDPVNETAEKCVMDMIRKAEEDIKDIEEAKPYLDRVTRTIEFGVQLNKNAKKPEEPWATLVHHDFWVNNMMFRHDEHGELLDMKIVDFQLCMYDYGVHDLIFFLVSSAKNELLDNKLDDMIDYYYYAFVKLLKTLGVETVQFSKQKFDEIVNDCAPIRFNQCIMMAQVLLAPRGSTPDTNEIKKDSFLNRNVDNKYTQKLLHTVKLFDERGWLIK